MASAFAWKEAYSVHVTTLDRQHQQLFGMISELNDALAAGKGNEVVGRLLDRLVDYTVSHFTAEEKLLERYGYAGLAEHHAKHQELVTKLNGLLQDFKAGNLGVSVSLMLFLRSWLKDHILGTDKQYSEHLNRKGLH